MFFVCVPPSGSDLHEGRGLVHCPVPNTEHGVCMAQMRCSTNTCRMKEGMSEPLQGPGFLLPELACPRLNAHAGPPSPITAFILWPLAALAHHAATLKSPKAPPLPEGCPHPLRGCWDGCRYRWLPELSSREDDPGLAHAPLGSEPLMVYASTFPSGPRWTPAAGTPLNTTPATTLHSPVLPPLILA